MSEAEIKESYLQKQGECLLSLLGHLLLSLSSLLQELQLLHPPTTLSSSTFLGFLRHGPLSSSSGHFTGGLSDDEKQDFTITIKPF